VQDGIVQILHQQVDVDAVGLGALADVFELRYRAAYASQAMPHKYPNRLGVPGDYLSNCHIGCDHLLLHVIPPH
jgi:hypothetical protein